MLFIDYIFKLSWIYLPQWTQLPRPPPQPHLLSNSARPQCTVVHRSLISTTASILCQSYGLVFHEITKGILYLTECCLLLSQTYHDPLSFLPAICNRSHTFTARLYLTISTHHLLRQISPFFLHLLSRYHLGSHYGTTPEYFLAGCLMMVAYPIVYLLFSFSPAEMVS